MSSATRPTATPLLDFKSATLYTVRLVLHSADTDALLALLAQRMQEAGGFFENETVVIDASRVDGALDWARLLQALREHSLRPIGVVAQDGPHANLQAAQKQGLVAVDVSTAQEKAAAQSASDAPSHIAPDTTASAPSAPHLPTLTLNRPLRSGQRMYAQQSDLIVTGVVSAGAEIIADGHIHVYGALRGRAIAGARGDTQARIFSTDFNPELVAIAGVYQTLESQLEARLHRKPCMVSLDGTSLHITALGGAG